MPSNSREEIIQQCKKGDRKAQMLLYDEMSAYLYTVSLRILKDEMQAMDVMQEVMIQFFDKAIFQLKRANTYPAFLKKMTVNKSIDIWKKKRYFLEIENIEIQEVEKDEPFTFEVQWKYVLEQLKTLEEKYRIMIELFYLQEYSHKEISEMLGIGYSNSRVMLKRAVDQLKKKCYENAI